MNFKIVRKLCVKVVFFSKEKSLLTVSFWYNSGLLLVFMKLCLPEKLGTLNQALLSRIEVGF